jgi:hypothetical protein
VATKKQPSKAARGRGQPPRFTLEFVRAEATAFLDFITKDEGILFLQEFIVTRDYGPQRWSEWARDYAADEEFSEAIKKGEAILEMRLLKMGIRGETNPALTIFALANKYGYSRTDRPTDDPRERRLTELPIRFPDDSTDDPTGPDSEGAPPIQRDGRRKARR